MRIVTKKGFYLPIFVILFLLAVFFPVIVHAQENPLLNYKFWQTATIEDVKSIKDNYGEILFDLVKENEHLRGDVYWRLNEGRFQ